MKFLKTHAPSLTLSLLTAALLSACGGGGGGSDSSAAATPTGSTTGSTSETALAISSSNYETAGNEATAAAMSLSDLGSADMLTGAVNTSAANWTRVGAQYAALAAEHAATPAALSGAVQTQTSSCSGGGTVTITVTTDGDNTVEAGESVALTFKNCKESSGTMSGGLTFLFNKTLTGDLDTNVYNMDATMTFSSIVMVTPSGSTLRAEGALRLASYRTAYRTGSDTISATSFAASMTTGGSTASRTITNYSSTSSYTTAEISTTVNGGTVVSSACEQKALTVYTASPFRQRYTDSYPYSGSLVATGSGSTSVTLTALSATTVQLSLDSNGDGKTDRSTNKSWSSIL